MNHASFLKKLVSYLIVRSVFGGLEISDAVLRLAYFDSKGWHLGGIRLEPGVVESGKIKNKEKVVAALIALKKQVFGPGSAKKKINVIVSLSSISIYSQVFSLPIIKGENLEKAIQLNVQMVSPVESSQAYSGWQLVGEDQRALRLEILSSFIERAVVDGVNEALMEAGFFAVAVESRALSLTRLVRDEGAGMDLNQSYIALGLDNSGLDLLVVRRGQLYFEYFTPWRDITSEKGEITTESLETVLIRNMHQVLNFYGQHWTDPVSEIIISASSLGDKITDVIKSNFSIPVRELRLKTIKSVGPEWFVVLGCSLRGLKPRSEDKEVSLLGIGAQEEFRRSQFLEFLRLWRILAPVALGILLLVFIISDAFLIQTQRSLESSTVINLTSEQQGELQTFLDEARSFNSEVAMIKSAESAVTLKTRLWGKVSDLLSANGVSADRFYFQSKAAPIILSGFAKSEDQIISFKKALEADTAFESINLALTDIKSDARGGYSFSLTFLLK